MLRSKECTFLFIPHSSFQTQIESSLKSSQWHPGLSGFYNDWIFIMEKESWMHVSLCVVRHNGFFFLLSFGSCQIVALLLFQGSIIDSQFCNTGLFLSIAKPRYSVIWLFNIFFPRLTDFQSYSLYFIANKPFGSVLRRCWAIFFPPL